jgi:hypothetical protein
MGLIGGVTGLVSAIAGLSNSVMAKGASAVDQAWGFACSARAELVVAGVGRPAGRTELDHVALALGNAMRLVRRGGKIAVLSRAEGPIGPALQRLVDAEDIASALARLKGHEADPDYSAALVIARARAWADVYLLSALREEDVDALSLVALGRPEEVRRLAAVAESCIVVSQAERVRASVVGEAD